MNKTQELIDLINKGTHKINSTGKGVDRLTAGHGWVTDSKWRKDVVRRAFFHFYVIENVISKNHKPWEQQA